MRLRTRFTWVLAVFLLAIIMVATNLARWVVTSSVLRADEELARSALERGMAVLADDAAVLLKSTADWAFWDDTYAFMANRNQEYVDSNIVQSSLDVLRLHVIALYNTDRTISACLVAGAGKNASLDLTRPPERLAERVGDLLALAEERQTVSGYLWNSSNLWMVAAAQILTSNREGPSRGTLLMGRQIDGPELERLSHLVHPSVSLSAAATGWVPGVMDIQAQNLHALQARVAVADVFGAGRVLLDLSVPRVAFSQVSVGLLYLTAWIVACGAAISLFSFGLLNRWVLRSVTRSVTAIRSGVASAATSNAMPPRLQRMHADEIGDLVDAVNAVLSAYGVSQESMRASEARYRGLVEATPEAMAGVGPDGRILFANRAFARFAGVAGERELVGRFLPTLLPEGDAARVQAQIAAMSVGQSVELGPMQTELVGGSKRWFLTILTRVGAADGQPAYSLLCMHDITDRISAEHEADRRREEALQAQKLAALGTFVAGVAHEANNPNGIVQLNMHVLRRSLAHLFLELRSGAFELGARAGSRDQELARREQELTETVLESLDASERISGLISSLKSFAQPSVPGVAESVDVARLTESAVEWVRHDIQEKGCRLECALPPGLPPVRGNRQQLLQVLINLLQNACHAADHAGMRIRLTGAADVVARTVTLVFTDEGRGIPQRDIEHVTDPFFTTRRGTGGTGLGLSISVAIAKAHGGTLHIQSSEGKGTTVTLTLPYESGGEHAS